MQGRAHNPLSPPRQTLGLSTPRPSRPNPHPTPLTPRTPRGEWTPRQRDGCRPARNAYSDHAGLHPSPWLFGQCGCGHFIKSPHIICRLAHRKSTDRQKTAPCRFRPVKRSATLLPNTRHPRFVRVTRVGYPLRSAIVRASPSFRFNRLQALYQEPAHYLSASAQTERGEACGGHSGRAGALRCPRPAPSELGGCNRPPCPPASRGSLAVFAAVARLYMFKGGGGRAVIVRLFIIVWAAVRAVWPRHLAPCL